MEEKDLESHLEELVCPYLPLCHHEESKESTGGFLLEGDKVRFGF